METETLLTIHENDRFSSFKNLFLNELKAGRPKKFWITQIILWCLIVIMIPILFLALPTEAWNEQFGREGVTQIEAAVIVFFGSGAIAGAFFIPALTQGVIVDDLEYGTAAWIMSKPTSRTSYILSKFAANSLAFIVVTTGIPGIIGLGWFIAYNAPITPIGYLIGIGLTMLSTLYYLFLTVAIGTVLESRSKALVGSLGLIIGVQALVNIWTIFDIVTPFFLTFYVTPWVAVGMEPLIPMWRVMAMIITPIVQMIFFIAIAIWSINRKEL